MPSRRSGQRPRARGIVGCMEKLIGYLIVLTICLSVLMAAGQTFIALLRVAAPLVLAIGVVIVVLRLVWHYTDRDRM